jgi:hypothetical protein
MNLVRRVESLESRMIAMRTVLATPTVLDSPADVLALLEEQVNAVRADPMTDPSERARTLGMLAGLALRAMDSRDLQARLEAVERVLKLRKANERDDNKRSNGHGR